MPDVSVIIAAYNAMPYLTKSVTSALEQSIGRERLEIIAVNDGSTDTTGAELDRLAEEHPATITVLHQENSGSAAGPRNRALDHARGRFVFFLDADDYLGPEALERMVGAADRNSTDVVLGKTIGVGGRTSPTMYKKSEEKTDVFSSRVYWTLNPMKLYRRELIEKHRLRFGHDLKVGEDQPFTALAYLRAAGISVVADYDCVFWVHRDDGGNSTKTVTELDSRVRVLQHMMPLVAAEVPEGPNRDHLLHRHLDTELPWVLRRLPQLESRTEQERIVADLRPLFDTYYTDALAARLPAMLRLQCHLVRHGMLDELLTVRRFNEVPAAERVFDVTVEDGRAYAHYPYFRDDTVKIPDAVYDYTDQLTIRQDLHRLQLDEATGTLRIDGTARFHRVDGQETSTALVLRERNGETEHRIATDPGAPLALPLLTAAGGTALPAGTWDVFVSLTTAGLTRETRLGSRSEDLDTAPADHELRDGTQLRPVRAYFTPRGNLSVKTGAPVSRLKRELKPDDVRWSPADPARLLLGGTLRGLDPAGERLLVRLTDAKGHREEYTTDVDPATGRFEQAVPLAAGEWRVHWLLDVPGATPRRATRAVEVPRDLPVTQWRRRLVQFWYAKPLPAAKTKTLTLRVGRKSLLKALLRK
ncbi:CDP-glycerol glycerophosphotransferase [Streptomyces harbinensis]|uniref:CDP-glycerol glycerophosphotransferase n=2 Tax=Streptomyces harbinensis TaxID=1176198 RepID=A0A1I6UNV0_9ACTN|nr:glycosyltransferase family 2 protein [Streptomyces harbinensis]SFT03111.1 CDP-glycerol glycerophosphotransferase [Streptomyces harbinensis]